MAFLVGGLAARSSAAEQAGAPGPARKASALDAALGRPISVSWSGAALASTLEDVASHGQVKITLDPELPAEVGKTPVTYSAKDVPLRVALGNALRAAGLRYAVLDGELFVSTPERVARTLIYGPQGATDPPEAEPMQVGEALGVLTPSVEDPDEEMPWCRDDVEVVNPVTGLSDYPAPPIFGVPSNSPDAVRFRYTDRPSYLKPEYLDAAAAGTTQSERELLLRLVELIRRNPEWARSELLKAMERGPVQ